MGERRGRNSVELVAQAWRDAAERARLKAGAVLSDAGLTAGEREQAHGGLLNTAKKCEEHARWWITGEGPPP